MNWFKRNLFWVLGGSAAMALLGLSVFYLANNVRRDWQITASLNAAIQRLDRLARRDPYPNVENISAARREAGRVGEFLAEVQSHFAPSSFPGPLNNAGLRSYLETTRARLLAEADQAGVELPRDYWFTFGAQKGAMIFDPQAIPAFTSKLSDVRTVCEALFNAKVNTLNWIRRVPVDALDSQGTQDYLAVKPSTNAWMTTTPYEVTFQGFSSELANLFENLNRLPQCFVVRKLVVEPAPSVGASSLGPAAPLMTLGGDPYRSRYRLAPAPISEIRARPAGPCVLLDQKPLRITLSIEAVECRT